MVSGDPGCTGARRNSEAEHSGQNGKRSGSSGLLAGSGDGSERRQFRKRISSWEPPTTAKTSIIMRHKVAETSCCEGKKRSQQRTIDSWGIIRDKGRHENTTTDRGSSRKVPARGDYEWHGFESVFNGPDISAARPSPVRYCQFTRRRVQIVLRETRAFLAHSIRPCALPMPKGRSPFRAPSRNSPAVSSDRPALRGAGRPVARTTQLTSGGKPTARHASTKLLANPAGRKSRCHLSRDNPAASRPASLRRRSIFSARWGVAARSRWWSGALPCRAP